MLWSQETKSYFNTGTPRYSDRLCSDRCYSDSPQSGLRVANFILNRPTGSTDWKDAEPNPEKGAIWAPYWVWHFKILVRKFEKPNCLGASINAVLSMHATPSPHPMFSNFYYFYICLRVLKMYWVVVTADCRNSVCRNSVCLPIYSAITFYVLTSAARQHNSQHVDDLSSTICGCVNDVVDWMQSNRL